MQKLYILLVILLIFLSCCSIPFVNTDKPKRSVSTEGQNLFKYTESLTINDVTTTLRAAGLQLNPTQAINPNDYQIDDIRPVVYSLKQSDHLLLYNYQSISRRKEADWTGGYFGNYCSRDIPQKENWFYLTYTAKNFVIIYMVGIDNFEKQYSDYNQVFKPLKTALFSLNNIQQMVFWDKGDNFDARLNVEYYQHWYKDDQDRIGVDQYSNGQWQVEYLGAKSESIHNIYYEYKTPSGGCSGNEDGDQLFKKIGPKYFLRLGNMVRSGIPYKDTVYTLTIKWNGQKETLHLKAVQQFFPTTTSDYFDANLLKYPALRKYMTPPYSSF